MNINSIKRLLESSLFQNGIIFLIVINSLLIGLETSDYWMRHYGHVIDQVDLMILGVFIVEITLKLVVYHYRFFKNAWNVFDLMIILISVVPAASSFTVFRAFRILRTLRLVKNVPKLRFIIESLLKAIPSIGWIVALLLMIFYVFAVLGTNLYGEQFPVWFGSLGKSMFTLFQIMTLESWSSGIARPVMSEVPIAALYFIVFILVATYTTLNVFIAIVVNTMNEMHHQEIMEEDSRIKLFVHEEHEQLKTHIGALSDEIRELKQVIEQQHTPTHSDRSL
ncbi:MAG: ion transporter [Cyclobacteriaceae bacterium]